MVIVDLVKVGFRLQAGPCEASMRKECQHVLVNQSPTPQKGEFSTF